MQVKLIAASIVLLWALPGTARSAEPVPPVSDADPSCACVAQGKRFAQGDEVCLAGLQMICGMNQNISTWKSLGTSCQLSSLSRVPYRFTAM